MCPTAYIAGDNVNYSFNVSTVVTVTFKDEDWVVQCAKYVGIDAVT